MARTEQHDANALVPPDRSHTVASSSLLGVVVGITVTALVAFLALGALSVPSASAATPTHPYAGGGVIPFGDAHNYGAPTMTLSSVITGMATTPDGAGYWLVGTDGGVFAYGDAPFEGSLGSTRLDAPVVAMTPTPHGKGYWLVGLDGGVFAFGDAKFSGSMGGTRLSRPVVGMAATPDGAGYWLVAADGGVFAFGDATYYGSMGATVLASSVTGMATTHDGKGYWLVAGDGGVFAFGDAPFLGSMGAKPPSNAVAGMARTPDGAGYWMVGTDGSVYKFGDAPDFGSTAATTPMAPVASLTPTPDGQGYWLLQPDDWSYSFSNPSPYSFGTSATITTIAESQVGPDTSNARGAFCNPYGPCEAWCALFVTWVWEHAGIPVPSIAFTGNIYAWAAAHGRILPGTALPAPGDAILFGTGPGSTATSVHTGIVVQVWPDGAVVTVEGDAGPAPNGALNTVINGPFLPRDSQAYNGFAVYAMARPVR